MGLSVCSEADGVELRTWATMRALRTRSSVQSLSQSCRAAAAAHHMADNRHRELLPHVQAQHHGTHRKVIVGVGLYTLIRFLAEIKESSNLSMMKTIKPRSRVILRSHINESGDIYPGLTDVGAEREQCGRKSEL